MTWDKPKSGKHWLLLFAPPSCCVVATVLGGLIEPQAGNWMAWSLIGLMLAMASAFVLSIWLARVNQTGGGKLMAAFICFSIYVVVNLAVSFAGCAAGSQVWPGMRFD
jgi:hypothetical protein